MYSVVYSIYDHYQYVYCKLLTLEPDVSMRIPVFGTLRSTLQSHVHCIHEVSLVLFEYVRSFAPESETQEKCNEKANAEDGQMIFNKLIQPPYLNQE